MKLNVLLFLPNEFPSSDVPVLENFYSFVIVREHELSSQKNPFEFISLIQRQTKAVSWISIGNVPWHTYLSDFPFEYRKKWIHRDSFDQWSMNELSFCYLISNYGHDLDHKHPLISVITTTFHSGEKLNRPLKSLQRQTYNNWEWIIWDDSKDDQTYEELVKLQNRDIRIQVYKAPYHSGFIGEMKRRSCGIAKGKWLVELDHDDSISPLLFEKIVQVDLKHPGTDFIYSDYAMIKEENNQDTDYGGSHYAYGYGSYMYQYSSDGTKARYYLTATNPNINAATIRYIVGVPNHVRIWRTSFYHEIQEHNPNLPVVDDYEILLRTFLKSKNWVRIPECLYFQYQNSGGNNFTLHRNQLIQYLTQWSVFLYESQIHERLETLGWKDEKITEGCAWDRTYFETPYFGSIMDSFSEDLTIIIPVDQEVSGWEKTLESIFSQKGFWKLYLIGNETNFIYTIVNWIEAHHPHHCARIDWWNMRGKTKEYVLLNYVLKMYITNVNLNRYVSYMKLGQVIEPAFLERWVADKHNTREMNERKGIYGWIHPMKMLEQQLWTENDDLENLTK